MLHDSRLPCCCGAPTRKKIDGGAFRAGTGLWRCLFCKRQNAAPVNNFDKFRKPHPALGHLGPKKTVKDRLSAPLHPGAIKYYKEKGWL